MKHNRWSSSFVCHNRDRCFQLRWTDHCWLWTIEENRGTRRSNSCMATSIQAQFYVKHTDPKTRPLYEHKKSIFQCKHKHAHSNCQCSSRSGLLGKQRRQRTIVLWPISDPDIGKQEEIPLCIEGYSWLQLKEEKKNGVGREGDGGGEETILWPRTSTYKHFRYQKSIRRDQNLSFPGSRERM